MIQPLIPRAAHCCCCSWVQHSSRSIGPLPAGMDALRALPLAEATAHLQKTKRVELQKLAKEAGTKVWTLGSVVHAQQTCT